MSSKAPGQLLLAGAALTAAVLIAVVGGAGMLAGRAPEVSQSPTVAFHSPSPSLVPSQSPATSASPLPAARTASPTPRPTARVTPAPGPTGTPTATVHPNAAPSSAADFDLEGQAIEMVFPLRPETRYRYRDNFLGQREGPPESYNHARLRSDGELVRLHDGVDIYAQQGEPVVAPFSGTVADPSVLWPPWMDDRYGVTVVVVSDEPASAGYAAVLVHLERAWVEAGQQVTRGQVLGVLGGTGNAESVDPQLHFELRAPFLLDWSALGEDRQVDAFDPYPSLVRADPDR